MTTTLTLPMDDTSGVLTAIETIDYSTGNTRYDVTGPRISGTFVIRPPHYGDDPIPTDLGVWYGDGHPSLNYADRPGRPVINGVRLTGGTVFADPAGYARITRWRVNAQVATSRYTSRPAPEKTAERAAAVIRALLGRYWNHPDRRAIIRAAARYDAASRLAGERRTVARLRSQSAEIAAELAEHTRRAALLSRLAAEHARQHPRTQPPGEGGTREDAA